MAPVEPGRRPGRVAGSGQLELTFTATSSSTMWRGWRWRHFAPRCRQGADTLRNVVANNDSTATSGNAIDLATFTSTPQPAGIVARAHSQDNPALGLLGLGPAVAAACADAGSTSRFCNPDNPDPVLTENIIWHNRSFYYGETPPTDPPDPAAPPYSLIPAANPYDDRAWVRLDALTRGGIS